MNVVTEIDEHAADEAKLFEEEFQGALYITIVLDKKRGGYYIYLCEVKKSFMDAEVFHWLTSNNYIVGYQFGENGDERIVQCWRHESTLSDFKGDKVEEPRK